MEQRKLIKLGNSSFAIALPKDWVEKSGLKKGDDIFLERDTNGGIVVASEYNHHNKINSKTEILTDGKGEREIARDIISAYTRGYEIITVAGEKEKIKLAKEISKQFVNLELISVDDKKATFKDLVDINSINLQSFIKRMDNNIKDMFITLISSLKSKKFSKKTVEEVEDIDRDITKFYFLVWRVMNLGVENPSVQSSLKMNPKSFVLNFWISYNLEQIGDELKRMSRKIEEHQLDFSAVEKILSSLSVIHENSMKAFFDNNKALAKEVILKRDEINKMCLKLSQQNEYGAIIEKVHQINASIHHNSKMIFYEI